jgi:hypothetical protein
VRELAAAHPVFTGLLLAGLALRVVTFLAYRPALISNDSRTYIDRAHDLQPGQVRPAGYPVFLNVLPTEWGLAVVPAVQHLFGLLIAVILYALLIRLGVPKLWSALAAAPVLLDGYQLNIEQYVLSEALFELLLVGACAALLWWRRPGPGPAALAGLLVAGALLTRVSALAVVAVAVLALVFVRAHWTRVVVMTAAFLVPVLAYVLWFNSTHGYYALNGYGGLFLYGRVAPFADCDGLDVPPQQRVLCPTEPPSERPTIGEYMWVNDISPLYDLELEEGQRRQEVAGEFARRIILHQPLDYAKVVAEDVLFGFSPTKRQRTGDWPVARWQFQDRLPDYYHEPETTEILNAHGYERGVSDGTLAPFLRTYQRYVFTTGPLLAIALLLGVIAALGIGRARDSGLRTAAFLFTFVGLAIYVPSVAASQFSWRYQLPLLVFLPPAGALALAALRGVKRRA